jgi:glucokinase
MVRYRHGMAEKQESPDGVVVGVDIGGTKVALLATDIATGEDLAHDRFATPADAGPAVMLEHLFKAVRRIVKDSGHEAGALRAIGIAAPGQVNADRGRVIAAGNLAGWRDIPLRDIALQELGVPVFVDNDANAAALGERWRGAAKQMHNFVFLALGTGVGAGLVINGRLHRGFHNAAGEVGNFIMGRRHLGRDRDGHGNLEALVGGPAIRRAARLAAGKKLKTEEAFDRADRDPKLEQIADRVADYIAITVVNIGALLDPEAIIFGGGTSAAGEPLIDRVRERLDRELPLRPALILSTLGEDAQLHGAVFGGLWQLDPDLALREELR